MPLTVEEIRDARTVEQVATLLNKSPRAVRRLIQEGHLDAFKVGRESRITERALIDYAERTRTRVNGKRKSA